MSVFLCCFRSTVWKKTALIPILLPPVWWMFHFSPTVFFSSESYHAFVLSKVCYWNHTKVLLRKYQEPPFPDNASYITLTQKPTPQGLWIKWVLWPINDSKSHHKHLHEDDTRFSCHACVHYAESRLSTARPHPLSLTHKYKCVHQGGLQCSSHQRQR